MDPVRKEQPTFSGGEFSPSLWKRTDIQKYSTGLRTAKNVIIHKHGGVSNRPGTEFVFPAYTQDKRVRLIPFVFSDTQAYVLEMAEGAIRFYAQGGGIIEDPASPGNPYAVTTTWTESQLRNLDYTQSQDVLFLVDGATRPKELARYGNADWELANHVFSGGPFMKSNLDDTFTLTPSAKSGTGITLTASQDLFLAEHVGALFLLRQPVQGQSVSASSGVSSSIGCGSTWRLVTHGTWAATINVEKSTDNGATWQNIRTFKGASDINHNVYGSENDTCLVRINISSGSASCDLSTDPYVHTGIVEVTAYTDAKNVTVKAVRDLGSTGATDNWAEGAWSNVRGWPGAVAFYQERFVTAATASQPFSTFMSQIGDYGNHFRNSPLLDTDGITVDLTARRRNQIRSLIPFDKLVALTSDSEFLIGPASDSAVTPSSVRQYPQGYRGCANVKPVIIGTRVIYVQSRAGVVRDLDYDFATNKYSGDELSIFSTHLFENHTLVELAYQQEPDSILWVIRDDGVLLSLTYLREQQMLAWTRHEIDGEVESICTIPGDGYDELWMAVKRTVDGQTVRYIERMVKRMESKAVEDQFFVDCGYKYTGDPVPTLDNLDWLEGKEVSILADGNVQPRQTVVNGEINIANEASTIIVGLPYVSDVETLNIDEEMQNGSITGRKAKVSAVTMSFLDTRGGMVGPDADHLYDWQQRTPDDHLGEPLSLFSGDHTATLDSTYEEGGRVLFRQSDPLPFTLLAITPEVVFGD